MSKAPGIEQEGRASILRQVSRQWESIPGSARDGLPINPPGCSDAIERARRLCKTCKPQVVAQAKLTHYQVPDSDRQVLVQTATPRLIC